MQSYVAILIWEREFGGYTVLFPDVPGCVTQGEDTADAQAMAVDALSGHIAVLREYGDSVPPARDLEEIKADRAYARENEIDWKDVTAVLVPVRPPLGKPERVNVSLDSNKLRAIDAYATRRGLTRSAVLEAGAELLMEQDPVPPQSRSNTRGLAEDAARYEARRSRKRIGRIARQKKG
jgi:predicted RNase H-like HicB family nuclease